MGSPRKTKEVPFLRPVSPQRIFLVIGTVFGLIFLFITPPFQVADEPQHFYCAYLVSELGFFRLVELNKDEKPLGNEWSTIGASLPSSLAYLVDGSDMVSVHKQGHRKIQVDRITSLMSLPLYPGRREYLPVAPYPPIAYFPQATGMALGRFVGLPPLVLFYLGRLFALAAWIGIVYLAIKKTPLLKWTFCLLALMPMTLSLAPSLSSDSLTSGISFLLIAYLLFLAYDKRKSTVNRQDIYTLFFLSIILALCKAVYVPLVFMFFLIPTSKFESKKKYFLTFASVLTAGIAAYLIWGYLVSTVIGPGPTISLERHAVDSPPFSNVSRPEQVAFILSHPGHLVDVLVNTVSIFWSYLLNTFVGLLGWVDTWLPSWIPYVYIAALVGVAFLDDSTEMVSLKARLFSLAIFSGIVFASLFYIYTGWNSVGADLVEGFQGRYLIPIAPAFFFALGKSNFKPKTRRWIPSAVISFSIIILSTTVYSVVERFYLETPLTFTIDQLEYTKDDFVFIKGWAIDRTSDSTASAVLVNIDGKSYQMRYGGDRSDVASVMNKPSYRYSGFEARIPADEIGKGRHALYLEVVTRNRNSYEVPKRKVIFKLD